MRKASTSAIWVAHEQSRGQATSVDSKRGIQTVEPITVIDQATGTSAGILAEVGFNCFSFRPVVDGRTIDVIWAEEGFGARSELALHGIPLLFPFAGRLEGTSFAHEGKTYPVTGAIDAGGNVIHGFVISRAWRIVAQSVNEVTGEFHASIDDPSLLAQWPADFLIRVTYRVDGASLICDVVIENPDDKPLPFGFGTHPYFRVPLGSGQKAESVITIQAADYWVHEGALPTGEVKEVAGLQDFRAGKAFPEVTWDGVLSNLDVADDGLVHTFIENADSAYRLEQTFPPEFRNAVVWVPPHREAIAVEPWTTVPNAFALAERGIETGLSTLAPGERWSTSIAIGVTTL